MSEMRPITVNDIKPYLPPEGVLPIELAVTRYLLDVERTAHHETTQMLERAASAPDKTADEPEPEPQPEPEPEPEPQTS